MGVIATSQIFTVPAGSATTSEFDLHNGDSVAGSISVSGGSGNDINFYITDPNGQRIVNYARITQTSFSFTASTAGTYIVTFDNSFSIFSSKSVTLDYSVALAVAGIPRDYILILLAIIVVVLVIAAIAFIITRRKPKSSLTSPETKTSQS